MFIDDHVEIGFCFASRAMTQAHLTPKHRNQIENQIKRIRLVDILFEFFLHKNAKRISLWKVFNFAISKKNVLLLLSFRNVLN